MSNDGVQTKSEEQAKLAKTVISRERKLQGVYENLASFGGHVTYGNNVVIVIPNSKFYPMDGTCECVSLSFRNGGSSPKGKCSRDSRKCDIFKDGCEILTKEMEDTIRETHIRKYPALYKTHNSNPAPSNE
jgi:hypothetical protein